MEWLFFSINTEKEKFLFQLIVSKNFYSNVFYQLEIAIILYLNLV